MQKNERSAPANKTAQAEACLKAARAALEQRDRFESELAILEYLSAHREGLRAPEQSRLDDLCFDIVSALFRRGHDGKLR